MYERIDRERVSQLVAAGATLVDVLPRSEYRKRRLPGAINIPLAALAGATGDRLARHARVVVYCADRQ